MLRARVLSALVLIPVVILLIYLGGIPWAIAIALVGGIAWGEMSRLLQRSDFAVDRLVGLFFVVAAIGEAYLRGAGILQVDLLRPLLALLIIASLIYALYDKSEQPTAQLGDQRRQRALSRFHAEPLRHPAGTCRTACTGSSSRSLMTWIGDTFAYFVGSTPGQAQAVAAHQPEEDLGRAGRRDRQLPDRRAAAGRLARGHQRVARAC